VEKGRIESAIRVERKLGRAWKKRERTLGGGGGIQGGSGTKGRLTGGSRGVEKKKKKEGRYQAPDGRANAQGKAAQRNPGAWSKKIIR